MIKINNLIKQILLVIKLSNIQNTKKYFKTCTRRLKKIKTTHILLYHKIFFVLY